DEQRAHRELRAQPVDLRVLDGECIQGAVFRGEDDGAFVFAVADNTSKFRGGDPLVAGDGVDLEHAMPLAYGTYDAKAGILRCDPDPYARDVELEVAPGRTYVLDRRPLGLQGRLRDAVRAAFTVPQLASVLRGEHSLQRDAGRFERARTMLA